MAAAGYGLIWIWMPKISEVLGSAAAIAINADLVEEDVRDAVHDFNQGFLP